MCFLSAVSSEHSPQSAQTEPWRGELKQRIRQRRWDKESNLCPLEEPVWAFVVSLRWATNKDK